MEDGVLALDDAVDKYLPQFANRQVFRPALAQAMAAG